ncbi:MAG TPA: enolase C-terminal domain-like protein [Thermoplasmata archaeon]|nr:enolase C-terminal domain-like protein [Thermoplasmata archaeon]
MAAIERATIRKILDSRGHATVEVDLQADGRFRVAAPSGASTGAHEAQAFPQGGVEAALRLFAKDVAPRLRGRNVADQEGLDHLLREIDGTPNFSRIGGDVAVAVSLANAKAAASAAGQPLYRFLGGSDARRMPFPFGNVIGGGRHAVGGTTIQEFLVVSQGPTVVENVFANARVHHLLKDALAKKSPGVSLGRGDEGAWVAKLDDEEALGLVADACEAVERDVGFPVRPGMDLAASEFFSEGRYRYRRRTLTRDKQIEFVERLVTDYRVYSLEDPLDEEDFEGFAQLTEAIGKTCVIIGDDIFCTNVARLQEGIAAGAGNAILIKPNQIGTLTETRATVEMARSAGYATIVSHRSGETTDDTIAHLAVAFGSLGIKTGTVGGERTAKLNELIRIEEELHEGT